MAGQPDILANIGSPWSRSSMSRLPEVLVNIGSSRSESNLAQIPEVLANRLSLVWLWALLGLALGLDSPRSRLTRDDG